MKNGCLICGYDLEYFEEDILMKCELCGSMTNSKCRCVNGHFVCDECHSKGLDSVISFCLNCSSKDPVEIINNIMKKDFCHMHGPEHHSIVGASLLTAYYNAGGSINLEDSLLELFKRSKNIPGGTCGYWGACGAGVSAGIFISIISESTPLSVKPFSLSNRMTSKALDKIADFGGPRCCKRDSYLSIIEAIDFVKANFSIKIDSSQIICNFSIYNKECLKENCPFYQEIEDI